MREKADYSSFGEFLLRARKRIGETQEDIAKKTGVSINSISKWEKGFLPHKKRLPSLAPALKVTNEDITNAYIGNGQPPVLEMKKENILHILKAAAQRETIYLDEIIFLVEMQKVFDKNMSEELIIELLKQHQGKS